MEELLFFAVIIFFSIIESIARSRKAKRQQSGEGMPDLPLPPEVEPDWRDEHVGPMRDNLPTYDEEPSYDDAVSAGARGGATRPSAGSGTISGSSRTTSSSRGGVAESRPSSETMLPGGLFEELAELAGQLEQAKARPIKLPKQSPPIPRAPRPAPVELYRGEARKVEKHRVHRAHAGYGTDPSERARSEQDGLDPLATFLSEDARAVREQLASSDPSQLRRAFILHEVFGPPVSLREEGGRASSI